MCETLSSIPGTKKEKLIHLKRLRFVVLFSLCVSHAEERAPTVSDV